MKTEKISLLNIDNSNNNNNVHKLLTQESHKSFINYISNANFYYDYYYQKYLLLLLLSLILYV